LGKRGRQSPRRLRRRTAFQGIFSAFRWLTEKGSLGHAAEWLGGYPLLIVGSPRNAFLGFEFLCRPSKQQEESRIAIGPSDYLAIINAEGSKGSTLKDGFVGLIYLDAACNPGDVGGNLLQQQEELKELFRDKHGSDHVLVVRSDSLQSNGNNSIKESVTNLICAEYFISKGYMVLADCESGPDLIVFNSGLVEELRERRFIGKGASVSQLATIRSFGKVAYNHGEHASQEEVIAVESESANPNKGADQLMKGYQSPRFSYMGFFDRRVLAAPFLSERKKGLDVLTYGIDGIDYWKCSESRPSSNFWKGKKLKLINEIENVMKKMLLMNFTGPEVLSMVSSKHLTPFAVSQESAKTGTGKILDKIEANLQV
jgi:hypothetical protein